MYGSSSFSAMEIGLVYIVIACFSAAAALMLRSVLSSYQQAERARRIADIATGYVGRTAQGQ
jgi:hypothetical protein